jgi:hypothetical protein
MWRKLINRMLLIGATAVAGALIATPAIIGLSGNTSFTRDIQVPVPSGAQHIQLSDLTPSAGPQHASARRREVRRGVEDRHGVEDHPGRDLAPSATTDDHGGLRSDDHGGRRTDNSESGRGPSGTDDHGGRDDRAARSGRSGGDG